MKGDTHTTTEKRNNPLYPTWFRWKWKISSFASFKHRLYIPHGSDESQIAGNGKEVVVTFISHMVQMKAISGFVVSSASLPFISHMVQMKDSAGIQKRSVQFALYPTWFRWKESKLNYDWCKNKTLYPTWFRWKKSLLDTTTAVISTLYPTWFRWKICAEVITTTVSTCFISHMVQMKGLIYLQRQYHQHPLYPTWFRWKIALKSETPTSFSLYIPHGSDERKRPCLNPISAIDLYIPHGSDESAYEVTSENGKTTLYPTWFRWKQTSYSLLLQVLSLYPTWFRWK